MSWELFVAATQIYVTGPMTVTLLMNYCWESQNPMESTYYCGLIGILQICYNEIENEAIRS